MMAAYDVLNHDQTHANTRDRPIILKPDKFLEEIAR